MQYPTVHKEYPTALSDWGPYSKHLAGISHIENKETGEMLEFSVFPAQYRGAMQVPVEVYPCNQYPWYAREDLRFYTYRFEVEWKDRVYCDVSYWIQNEQTVLVRARCVNNTEMSQNLCLHYMANSYRPPLVSVTGHAVAVDPLAYQTLVLKGRERAPGLNPDGKLRGEVLGGGFVNGHALGDLFGKTEGDSVTYTVAAPESDTLYVRASGHAVLQASGVCSASIELDSDAMTLLAFPLEKNSGELTLTCTKAGGAVIDYIGLGKAGEEPSFSGDYPNVRPTIDEGDRRAVLTYAQMKNTYGIGWQGELSEVREFLTHDLATVMPYNIQNHVSKVIGQDKDQQYTDVFVRPIPLAPGEEKTFYAVFTCGDAENVEETLNRFVAGGMENGFPEVPAPQGTYGLSQQLMRATMLTNVVFPVRLLGRYVRHFTPGKWWDSLYTWDNGFIAMGFSDFAPKWAEECLNLYLTEPGNPHCVFIHHGSMVPVQAYVYKKIFDATGDLDFLRAHYDEMRQYYDFYVGRNPLSTTNQLDSGLLSTFRYFYNSGGWDDYPPQHAIFKTIMENFRSGDRAKIGQALAEMQKTDRYATASNTAHAINFARIMAHAAHELGLPDDDYKQDIKAFADALQTFSYDPESGYFGYVVHDDAGKPTGVMRCETGENYNMGLDGAYPLMAGVCTDEQRETLAGRIMDPSRMWTNIGISVVDQSAPYYRRDGYWNGSVWMPHQWFAFWGMLEYGYDEYAARIAETALRVWKNEADYSYRCYEHFMVESQRGAGWHCFGGLSSPVVMWYASLYTPGHITLPVQLHLAKKTETDSADTLCVAPCFEAEGTCTLLFVPRKPVARVCVNGEEVSPRRVGDALMIHAPRGQESTVVVTYKA